MQARIQFFCGKDIYELLNQGNDINIKNSEELIKYHEISTLVMGDIEDIIYRAVARVVKELFSS